MRIKENPQVYGLQTWYYKDEDGLHFDLMENKDGTGTLLNYPKANWENDKEYFRAYTKEKVPYQIGDEFHIPKCKVRVYDPKTGFSD